MALILEIRDRRGATAFHPLNGEPITIGRALSSDIILDDPYVDPRHVRIAQDDTGALTLSDLGSVNGVLVGGARVSSALPLQPGSELTIGRTTLRVRDRDEPVVPAVVDSSARVPAIARWALRPWGALAVLGTLIGITALDTWLSSTDRSKGSTVMFAVFGVTIFVGIWSGVWALSTRGPDRRLNGRAHLVVASAAMVVMLLYATLQEWLLFFFPDAWPISLLSSMVFLVMVAVVVVGHLTVAGRMTARLRWRAGAGVAAGILALVALGAAVRDDDFSDVPKFSGQLKAVPAGVVPTSSIGEFVGALADAKKEADKAIDK